MSSAGNEVNVEAVAHKTLSQVGTATVQAMDYTGEVDASFARDVPYSMSQADSPTPLGVRVGDGGPQTIITSTPVTTVLTVLTTGTDGRTIPFTISESTFSQFTTTITRPPLLSPSSVRAGDDGPETITSSTPVNTVSIPTTIVTNVNGQLTTFTTTSESTSFSQFTTTSTRPPLLNPSSASSEKSSQTNKVPIIVGSIIGGVMFIALILIGIKCYHRSRVRKPRRFQAAMEGVLNRSHPPIQPYDLGHEPVHFADGTRNQILPNNRLSLSEKKREMINPPAQSTQDVDSRDLAPELISRPQSAISVHNLHNSVHSAVTTSTMTVRQVQLQEEADDLRDQVRRLQQTVDSSNDGVRGMQIAMERMMAHIQTLESQLNSDWARGLTNDPPPVYAEA
ncbi:hypothetical protein VKT23_012991 [Stygiomarasmius scandens]|uniref:Mid2 domain-containing protein n=1 Tax=Marasmiellus scandens TaxID=2682957 RepID=A0ABR1J4U3_9AGAR